jgi:hypothetical protein
MIAEINWNEAIESIGAVIMFVALMYFFFI